jgi:hypothetical protein
MLKQSFAVEPIEGHNSEIRARDEREMSAAAVSTIVPGLEEHHDPIHIKSMAPCTQYVRPNKIAFQAVLGSF